MISLTIGAGALGTLVPLQLNLHFRKHPQPLHLQITCKLHSLLLQLYHLSQFLRLHSLIHFPKSLYRLCQSLNTKILFILILYLFCLLLCLFLFTFRGSCCCPRLNNSCNIPRCYIPFSAARPQLSPLELASNSDY